MGAGEKEMTPKTARGQVNWNTVCAVERTFAHSSDNEVYVRPLRGSAGAAGAARIASVLRFVQVSFPSS